MRRFTKSRYFAIGAALIAWSCLAFVCGTAFAQEKNTLEVAVDFSADKRLWKVTDVTVQWGTLE